MLTRACDLLEDTRREKKILFCVVEDDVQVIAKKMIGKELDNSELYEVGKGIKIGLSETLNNILDTAIEMAIEDC